MNIISTPTVCCMTVNKNVRFSKATLLFRSNSINSSGAMFLLENSEQIPWGCWVFFFLREPSIEYEFSEARVASLPRPQLFIVLAPPTSPEYNLWDTISIYRLWLIIQRNINNGTTTITINNNGFIDPSAGVGGDWNLVV